ncbi:insulinase family protein [Aliidiomarina quisquiliarum]|uniref:insulinase family protein n=1 Tax=Aliidiomarina quisquiliarum TaxID=2938947 RepID=UPI00208F423B|nr:insulinase family protein [Aliidiomarina quisquiliarum]MCO4321996.1 insulinase family protein [Aliidiomarina quisquiliarum]
MKMNYSALPKQPEASPEDPRQYKMVQLSNGLKVLVVHIPDASQAAAAVAINAGHFQDPDDTPGLAHFLEHMVFLGSADYPEAESYSDFISYAGGHHNAWTGTEHSNFYLELPLPHFNEGLKRFSSILSSPLFSEQWIEKERQAVEAEYRMKLKDELRRLYDVHKETSNSEHPFSRFSVGNVDTLQNSPECSLADKLKQTFARYYHAGNMALTLVGPQSTTELVKLAALHFHSIAPAQPATKGPKAPLYQPEQLGQWIYIKPIKEANRVLLTFALPEINTDYQHKTTSFIAHLFGYEGPNSLCSMLRAKGWITNLSAGGGASGSNFKDFNINIQLTAQGHECIREVIQACFRYAALIRSEGLQEALYAERSQMVSLAFLFPETLRPVDLAAQLSVNLLHYKPEHVISGDYRMDSLNVPFANLLLDHMRPENTRITVIHPNVVTNRKSKWYGAEYSTQAMSKSDLDFFCAPLPEEHQGRPNSPAKLPFAIPQPNPFVPQRTTPLPLEHKPCSANATVNLSDEPSHTNISAEVELWHFQDPDFRVPKGHLYLMLRMPFANSSARNYACSRIWCELGLELLNEAFYDAEVAGMHFNLYPQQGGITLHIAGFSCRQQTLFMELVSTLSTMHPSKTMFADIRDQLCINWLAVHKNSPVNHLFGMLHHHLQQGSYTAKQMAESLTDLDYEHFLNILPGLFREAQATLLVHGDWPYQQAEAMAQHAARCLTLTAAPSNQFARYVRRLSPGIERGGFTSSHPDHATAFFLQGENTSLEEKATFLLFNHIVNPLFFSELRTRQQLGYLVGTSYVPMYGLPGILLYIQSPNFDTDKISLAIQTFLINFLRQIRKLDKADWNAAKVAVAHHLRAAAPSLRIRSQRFWQTITHNRGDFQLAQNLADTVAAHSKAGFLARMEHHLGKQMAAMELHTIALTP